jgi:site-specific DNA-methyltransferase (adenine-specific)
VTRWKLSVGDGIDWIRSLPAESIDLVVTDPPYESLERHRGKGTTTRLAHSEASSNDWFPTISNTRLPDLLDGIYRALRPRRHAYILADEETTDLLKLLAPAAGFYPWKTLIWVKVKNDADLDELAKTLDGENQVRAGMGYHYRAANERILLLEKRSVRATPEAPTLFGGRELPRISLEPKRDPPGEGLQLRDRGMPDVLFDRSIRNGYPTEKPVSLLRKLISQSTEPGQVVAEPFGGSGSTAVAAVELGRVALVNELLPAAADSIRARLEAIP